MAVRRRNRDPFWTVSGFGDQVFQVGYTRFESALPTNFMEW